MLTGIGLRNFKAFGDEMQEAPLSKITLIYGPNSGGQILHHPSPAAAKAVAEK